MSSRHRKLRMEWMEPREMMAGDVSAYVQNGNLYLNEAKAGLDNAVQVSQLSNGKIRVEGIATANGTKSLINKAAFKDFTVQGSLFVNFGGGRDTVQFTTLGNVANFQDVNINVGVASATGDADKDQVSIANLRTRGSLSVLTGASNDAVYVNGTNVGDGLGIDRLVINTGIGADLAHIRSNTRILGDADIQTYNSLAENDSDTLYFDNNVYISKNLNARMGGGDDTFFVSTPSGSSLSSLALQVDGSMLVEMGAGNDQIYMAGADIGYASQGKLTLLTGAGQDSITIDNRGYSLYSVEIQTYDSLAENDADHVQIQNARIIGDLIVEMGGGDDTFFVTDPTDATRIYGIFVTGSMRVDTGAGNDQVHIEGTNIGDDIGQDDLVVYTGAGQDNVTLDFRALFQNHVMAVTGNVDIQTYELVDENDADQVHIYDGIVDNLFARLGAGDDIFQLEDAEYIQGDLRMDAGAGNDTALISGFIWDHLMAFMGEGNDNLTLGYTWAYRLIADGGLGLDNLWTAPNTKATYFDKYSWEYINGVRTWDPIGTVATDGLVAMG